MRISKECKRPLKEHSGVVGSRDYLSVCRLCADADPMKAADEEFIKAAFREPAKIEKERHSKRQ